jgi:dTDP-4-amino-4,6-dideoxygalactose transaminase
VSITVRADSPSVLPASQTHWPQFDADMLEAAARVLASGKVNYWTGSECREFECEYAGWTGTRFAVALHNGTAALELAMRALGIGPGDDVVTTPRTFVATASSIALLGARPVFADVDLDSQNITARSIERVLTPATKAIIPVHLAGWPCDMDEIMALARERGLFVIEDCAQATGALFRGARTGAFGDVNAHSFCQDKILSTGGEGGMITTNEESLWSSAWSFKDHGKSFDAVYRREHQPGFRWLHEDLGTNYRMLELQAAIGRVALNKVDEWVVRRRANASVLDTQLGALSALRIASVPAHIYHAYYKYYCFVRPEALKSGWSRDRIMSEVADRGAPCFSGSCGEVYLEKAFINRGLAPQERLPGARELGESSLMFLVHPTLGANDMEKIVASIAAVVEQATR